jgi:large subunit ribosomal protein L15
VASNKENSSSANGAESIGHIGLHNLQPAAGSHRNRKRIGRGPGSGTGKTSGKGHKGSMARSGHGGPGGGKPHFEGGQMPLTRRIPKRGFTNPFKEYAQVVRLDALAGVSGDEVTTETLVAAGLIREGHAPAKLLANGDVPRAFTVRGVKISAAAKAKIEAAGGRIDA